MEVTPDLTKGTDWVEVWMGKGRGHKVLQPFLNVTSTTIITITLTLIYSTIHTTLNITTTIIALASPHYRHIYYHHRYHCSNN